MWSELFRFSRSNRPPRRRPPEKSWSRRRRLQFEELESRVTPTCTVGIVDGVLIAAGDAGDDVIDLYHFEDEGVSMTFLCGQAFNPSDYSEIQISTGSGVNTVNIEATASGKPVTVFATPEGSNTVIFAPMNKTLSNIQGPVSVGGSIATLHVFDENMPPPDPGDMTGYNYTLTSTSISRVGVPGIFYSDVQHLVTYGGIIVMSGCHIYDIESTAAGTTYTIYGGSGWDTYNISPTAKKLVDIQGPLYLESTGGLNTINFHDENETSDRIYDLSIGSVMLTGSAPITYSNMDALKFYGGSGNDGYRVLTHAADATTTINAGDGDDFFGQLPPTEDLDMVQGTLVFNGDGGNDELGLRDTSNEFQTHTYTLTGSSVTRTGVATFNYSDIETIVIFAAYGHNTFNVNGTASGSFVSIQAYGGGDVIFNVNSTAAGSNLTISTSESGSSTFNIAPDSGNLQNVQGEVTAIVYGTGGGTLHLFNQNNGEDDATHTFESDNVYAVSRVTAFDGTANPTVINFTGISAVVFDGGPGSTDLYTHYNILSTATGTSLSIQGGAGHEIYTLGSSHRLDAILGAVFIDGRGGDNRIMLDDGERQDSYAISQDGTTISALPVFNFTYNGESINSLVLLTSPMSTIQIDDDLSFEVMVNP